MDKTEEAKDLFELADGDLCAAEYLLTMRHPRPDNIICFHCQQAAEKYLKGFLVFKGIEFPKTHDLAALLKLADTANTDFSVLLDKCLFLSPFAVEIRYSKQHDFTAGEVKLAIQYAKDIQAFVKKVIGTGNDETV